MNSYKHAKTTPLSRALIIERHQNHWTQEEIAASLGISRRTVCKWLARWRSEGAAGLADRASRPQRSPRKLAAAAGHHLLFLPRYSPDFNPIEQSFAILKRRRQFAPITTEIQSLLMGNYKIK